MSDWSGRGMGATVSRIVNRYFWAENVEVPAPMPPGYPFSIDTMREIAERQRGTVVRRLGHELYWECVDTLRQFGGFRQVVAREQRNRWWVIRNHEQCGAGAVSEAVFNILAADCMMQDADVNQETWLRMNACMAAGCTCDGCDLWDGQRFLLTA